MIQFIRNPHPVQVVAILLLLRPNINPLSNSQLTNSMAEIKTGEGKSIVLAGLCSFLALRGYHTFCACYSAYLSARDEE